MVLTLELPEIYPVVMLSATALPFITSTVMGGQVMSARKTFKVAYPNLYAVPGVHEKADEFNRVQRGHQNIFETLPSVMGFTLIGGLKYPRVAIFLAAAYCIGNFYYLLGYADTKKDVKGARYTKPLAVLKPIGMIGGLINCVVACAMMMM